MNAFVSEAQCAAMEHLADQGGVARYGHRPLTKATAMALGREGLVSITGYQVSLTLSGLRMYPPQGAGLVLSERERSVIAHLARQGGSARYGPRPLTGAIALLLRRTGLVLVTGSEVTLSERGRQLYPPAAEGAVRV